MAHARGTGRMVKIAGGAVIQYFAFDAHVRTVDAQALARDAHGMQRIEMIARHIAVQHDGQIVLF